MGNPTVMIVVDRIDLDTQIASTFYDADAPNLVKAETRSDLESMIAQDMRKIIITTSLNLERLRVFSTTRKLFFLLMKLTELRKVTLVGD